MTLPALQQFVPSAVCLECDGCCRFKESDSLWRPKVTAQELPQLKRGLLDVILKKSPVDSNHRIRAVACRRQTGHRCLFFKERGNTCGIYEKRPFECELYPFILSRKDGRPSVFVHLNCPFAQKMYAAPEFKDYIKYLQGFFEQPPVISFLKENPSLLGDYTPYLAELECLFPLHLF